MINRQSGGRDQMHKQREGAGKLDLAWLRTLEFQLQYVAVGLAFGLRISGGIPYVSTRFSLSMDMSRLARDGTAEPVSWGKILRRERGQGNIRFPCLIIFLTL